MLLPSQSSTMPCSICTEEYNKSTCAPLKCPYCSFTACRQCCQQYILNQEATVCMNKEKDERGEFICQKEWTLKFVIEAFPKTWVNGPWKLMNSKLAVEREKALFPATMPRVEIVKQEEALHAQLEALETEQRALKLQLENRKSDIRHIKAQQMQLRSGKQGSTKTFGRACPDSSCRGFLDGMWKCGLCDKLACSQCNVIIIDSPHQCDPDTLATANLLKTDTKPCPKCRTPIHKISGCDQMWCTLCHTAFSWKHGTIQTRVHNPHYFEWLRANNGNTAPRTVGDYECGRNLADFNGVQALTTIQQTLKKIGGSHKLLDKISNSCRSAIHLAEVQAPHFRTDTVVDNANIRVAYLMGKLDDKQFASKVLAANKAFRKKQDISNVIQLEVQGITDIIFRMAEVSSPYVIQSEVQDITDIIFRMDTVASPNLQTYQDLYKEITNLTDYCNVLLEEHSHTYDCKRWRIVLYEKNSDKGNVLL